MSVAAASLANQLQMTKTLIKRAVEQPSSHSSGSGSQSKIMPVIPATKCTVTIFSTVPMYRLAPRQQHTYRNTAASQYKVLCCMSAFVVLYALLLLSVVRPYISTNSLVQRYVQFIYISYHNLYSLSAFTSF